jgi:hypothetical protein
MMFFSKSKSRCLVVITFLVLILLASISKANPYESDLPETLTHPSPI